MKKVILRPGIALLVAFALGTPAFAVAASPTQIEVVSITVSYADLNIEKEAGAKKLYRRLQRAAENACEFKSHTVARESLSRGIEKKRCYSEALASAVEEIDKETLTRIATS